MGAAPAVGEGRPPAHQLINARAETLKDKPAFKEAFVNHRCLVPCDGFYEWRREGPRRVPHFVHDAGNHLLAMAGLWNRWRSPEGLDVDTFTIVTTRANEDLASLHDRMPVFLDAEGRERWLSGPTQDLAALEALLRPWHGSKLELTEVDARVNSVTVDDEGCLAPPTTVQLRLL